MCLTYVQAWHIKENVKERIYGQPKNFYKLLPLMHLTYVQAWYIKENAKERIYGELKNFYKLLPWMCERIKKCNPGLVVELTHSSDGHFEQLFIAHKVFIIRFLSGCRPVIAIDSSHMSGPYDGVLFSATSYDANDNMFPIAYGVMSSQN